jgi:hypothetical protein
MDVMIAVIIPCRGMMKMSYDAQNKETGCETFMVK